MRKTLKILHTLSSCGLIGGLFAYAVLLLNEPLEPVAYAEMRGYVASISNLVLIPSLGIALVSGLLAMMVHRAFLEPRWVWAKAALGILMFKGVLTIVGAKADHAANLAQDIVAGTATRADIETALAYEWWTLWTVLAISAANVVLGVWRPLLKRRSAIRSNKSTDAHATP